MTVDLGSDLDVLSSFIFSTTGSFSLVFALLQSSLPEAFGLSLDSVLVSGVVEACSFLSEKSVLPFVACCSVFMGKATFGVVLADVSKVVLDEDAVFL